LPNSAHAAALGGKNITVFDNELSFAYYNPALLKSSMKKQLSLNYSDYFLNINYGYVGYMPDLNNNRNIAFGMMYINYGKFIEADYTGLITGTFNASEYNACVTWSLPIDSFFTIGVNAKGVFSFLDRYFSMGLMTDIGVNYYNSENLLSASLVLKNIGFQVVKYTKNRESLPFEIQYGLTKKLLHAPFRYSIMIQHLEQLKMDYEVTDANTSIYGLSVQPSKGKRIFNNIIRHFIFGIEFMPMKTFYASFSYNFQRKQELQLPSYISTVGLSWGFGLNLNRFNVGFARCNYSLAGSTNNFSFTFKFK
jgi:hypothetical protein